MIQINITTGRWLKNILAIKMKLLQGNYVNGLMKNVRDMFYKKEIMEMFDKDTSLIGFDNGIYDLKSNIFREGRPEDDRYQPLCNGSAE